MSDIHKPCSHINTKKDQVVQWAAVCLSFRAKALLIVLHSLILFVFPGLPFLCVCIGYSAVHACQSRAPASAAEVQWNSNYAGDLLPFIVQLSSRMKAVHVWAHARPSLICMRGEHAHPPLKKKKSFSFLWWFLFKIKFWRADIKRTNWSCVSPAWASLTFLWWSTPWAVFRLR